MRAPHAVLHVVANRQRGGIFALRSVHESESQLRLVQAVLRRCRSEPAHRVQVRQSVDQRLHVGLIDLATSFQPAPLFLFVPFHPKFFVRRDAEVMDLFRLKLEDRQFLPLQRISENLVEQSATECHDKGLIGKSRVNIITIYFPKGDRDKWLLASFRLSSVLRGKRAERQLQLRLIEAVFRQVGSHVFNKFCHPLVLQCVD